MLRLAVLGAVLLAAPALAAEDDEPGCLLQPPVMRYLHAVEDRIIDRWGLPPDSLANQEVVVRLKIRGDGSLAHYKVVSWTNRRLALSVAVAIQVSVPFPPIPAGSECLIEKPILTTFRNPAD